MSRQVKRWLILGACLWAAACCPCASTKPVYPGEDSDVPPARPTQIVPRRASTPCAKTGAPEWPKYETVPHEDGKGNGTLRMVQADGTTTELVQMDRRSTRAPGFEPSPLKTELGEQGAPIGFYDVDLLASGFDLDGNGLVDALVSISSRRGSCEFNGEYFIAFALPGGRVVSSARFGSCSSFESATMTEDGLEVTFLGGKQHLAGRARPAPAPVRPSPSECVSAEFLANYANSNLVRTSTESLLVLDLPVDLHSADCGAPDCYGHTMTLTLELVRDGKACMLTTARAEGKTFECGGPGGIAPREWKNDFLVGKAIDLASRTLHILDLRDLERREAIVLTRDSYFFFENVHDRSFLDNDLQTEEEMQDMEKRGDFCFPYTGSVTRYWR